jgi:pimeloyl-ACP methyl ester carboxylesterase
MKNFESLVAALDDLRQRGYDADFEPQSNCLYCNNLDLRLYEEEFHIDEVYHFEGGSGHTDNTVVYALTAPGGIKGTAVDGASGENISVDMTKAAEFPGVQL